MDTSLNSSTSQPTVAGLKSIFKKPANTFHTFEVSLNESTTATIHNKSDGNAQKVIPFKKPRKINQESFNLSSDESITNSECEQSVTSVKPKSFFKVKKLTGPDPFDVSFNETNVTTTHEEVNNESASISEEEEEEESTTFFNKSNPFKRKKKFQNRISEKEGQIEISLQGDDKDGSQTADDVVTENTLTSRNASISGVDSTTFFEKPNPFNRKSKLRQDNSSKKENLEITFTEDENVSVESKTIGEIEQEPNLNSQNVSSTGIDSTLYVDKANPFKTKNIFSNEIAQKKGNAEATERKNYFEESKTQDEVDMEHNLSSGNTSVTGVDSTKYLTKSNPFKKNLKNNSTINKKLLEVSLNKENTSNSSFRNLSPGEFDNSDKTSQNKHDGSANNSTTSISKRSVLRSEVIKTKRAKVSSEQEESDVEISMESNALIDEPKRSLGNLSFDKNSTKLTNKTSNSELYLDQSSINDENLNNWMSDLSDEEMPPPTIPAIPPKLSLTKEKPVESVVDTTETTTSWEEKFQEIVAKSKKANLMKNSVKLSHAIPNKPAKKPEPKADKPQQTDKYKPPKLSKPAAFATKKLYKHIINKLEPKFGIDAVIEAEHIVSSICDTVKKVMRRKTHQKKLIQDLKKEMASAGLIETTVDFYEFVIKFLPYGFRVRVVPCLQPVTNTVYPPKDTLNPFDKIL